MKHHLASIVHLPDLHLFTHPDGRMRDPSDRRLRERMGIAVLGTVFHGLATADNDALDQLIRYLPTVIRQEERAGGQVIIVQTGDVETFGYVEPYGLAGFQFLHRVVWGELEKQGASIFDLYGNHDIWPGHPPLPGDTHDARHVSALPRIGIDWSLPFEVATSAAVVLRFHRLNTIIANKWKGGALARGGVGPHPPFDGGFVIGEIEDVLSDINDSAPARAEPTLDVVLCHHPPHLFSAGLKTRYTTGYLVGADDLADLTPEPITLVIAGHRHALNPPPAAQLDSSTGEQPPLKPGANQLVAESPTQRDGNSNSLSVYRLYLEDDGTVTVDRLRFGFTPASGLARTPVNDEGLIRGLRLRTVNDAGA
jgi:3',5'-cyclic AMP phosphodiesterase CpdA